MEGENWLGRLMAVTRVTAQQDACVTCPSVGSWLWDCGARACMNVGRELMGACALTGKKERKTTHHIEDVGVY